MKSPFELQLRLLSNSLVDKLLKCDKNKVADTLLKLNGLGYFEDSTRNVTLRSDGNIAFCPKGKPTVLTEGGQRWARDGRQESNKMGRVFRKILKEQVPKFKFKDSDIENLVNNLKSILLDGVFEIVSGDDIAEVYDENPHSESRTLYDSCMQGGKVDPDYFDIYCRNSDVIEMVTLRDDNGRLIGRALIWKLSEGKFMDRIYGNDSTIEKLKAYAKTNGITHKKYQSYSNKVDWIDPNGNEFTKYLTVNLKTDFNEFPYIDTFTYGGDGFLSNRKDNCIYEYESTGGDRCSNGVYDEYDDCYINEDSARYDVITEDRDRVTTHECNTVWSDDEYEYIIDSHAVEVHGDYFLPDSSSIVLLHNGDYELRDNAMYCDYSNEYYHCDDVEYLEEIDLHVNSNDVEAAYENEGYVNVDGSWVKEDEVDEEAA